MNYKETDDIWRLYRREWVIVHTMPDVKVVIDPDDYRPAQKVMESAVQWAAENLGGRVRDEDIRVQLNTNNVDTIWANVQVFKDNLKGEFKYVETAQQHARKEGYDEYVIVPRNSKSDHDIRNYGVVKL